MLGRFFIHLLPPSRVFSIFYHACSESFLSVYFRTPKYSGFTAMSSQRRKGAGAAVITGSASPVLGPSSHGLRPVMGVGAKRSAHWR